MQFDLNENNISLLMETNDHYSEKKLYCNDSELRSGNSRRSSVSILKENEDVCSCLGENCITETKWREVTADKGYLTDASINETNSDSYIWNKSL